jgi:hypothetical protein
MNRSFHHHIRHATGIPGMDALNSLTNTINQFVRFFESINCLFWQIRWLEENINRSGHRTIILVGLIIGFGVVYSFFGDEIVQIFGDNFSKLIPLIIVFGVILLFLFRRFNRSNSGDYISHEHRDRVYSPLDVEEVVMGVPVNEGIETIQTSARASNYVNKRSMNV